VHDPDTDAQHREGGPEAEHEVLEAQTFDGLVQGDQEVAGEEEQRPQDGDDEQQGDLPLCTLLRARITIGEARTVGREARVLELVQVPARRSDGDRGSRSAVTRVGHDPSYLSLGTASL